MLALCSLSVHIITASRGGIERAGLNEASVHSAHVRRRKQSALEDYAEKAVMMQYTNSVVTL